MKKINNKGWTLKAELFYVIIFVLCLVVAIIGIIKLNLLLGKTNLSNFNYSTLEKKLVEASKEYINASDYINLEITVTSEVLKNLGYLDGLKDNMDEECTGYVKILYDNGFHYKPYLKCNEYTTENYDVEKE